LETRGNPRIRSSSSRQRRSREQRCSGAWFVRMDPLLSFAPLVRVWPSLRHGTRACVHLSCRCDDRHALGADIADRQCSGRGANDSSPRDRTGGRLLGAPDGRVVPFDTSDHETADRPLSWTSLQIRGQRRSLRTARTTCAAVVDVDDASLRRARVRGRRRLSSTDRPTALARPPARS
jgi:hypothetical protein